MLFLKEYLENMKRKFLEIKKHEGRQVKLDRKVRRSTWRRFSRKENRDTESPGTPVS